LLSGGSESELGMAPQRRVWGDRDHVFMVGEDLPSQVSWSGDAAGFRSGYD